jgi:hypothetical protein
MEMRVQTKSLWKLVWGTPQIDAGDLADAVAAQARQDSLDFRTRLLIRDSVQALREYWGTARVSRWLRDCPVRESIERICREVTDEPGFSSIGVRLVDKTDPAVVERLFRDLGDRIRRPVRLYVGGSIALILAGYITKATDDIDLVDELPESVRSEHALLDELLSRYGLRLSHFQSHYLPLGWHDRVHYLDKYGNVQVYLVDVYDVFLSKLFSSRSKDMDDMHVLTPRLDKEVLIDRLKRTTESMLASESLRQRAEQNWYILFGEKLPYDSDTATGQGKT